MKKTLSVLTGLLVAFIGLSSIIPANAEPTQGGAGMVVLNPGGGVAEDGSDGLRIYFNTNGYEDPNDYVFPVGYDVNGSGPNYFPELGSDQVYYSADAQWCCGGAGPVLAVGSTSFGAAGAADGSDADPWNTVSVSGLGGALQLVSGDAPHTSTAKGSALATLTYNATVGGLTYSVKREINYVYPNNFYDEVWTVTVPTGNTEIVKLYVGGDAAPGDNDNGVGSTAVRSGLRTIYEANPDSGQYISYGERSVASAFTHYFVGHYSDPYNLINGGLDLDDSTNVNEHDAGLQAQWTFGSTVGSFSKSMRTTVGLNSNIGNEPLPDSVPVGDPATVAEAKPLGLDLSLDSTVGGVVPGSQVLLQGGGLIANSPLELVMRSTPVTINLNGQTADFAGNFSFRATLPASISAGVHSLTLTGTKPDGTPISDLLYFEIDASGKLLWSQADTPKALAKTGADSFATGGLVLAALALIGIGVALTASRRTKKA